MSLWSSPAARLVDRFLHERLVSRIWDRDPRAWGADAGSADERSIRTRLGWLDVGETMPPAVTRARKLAQEIAAEQFDAVYLLGMGGSSLCAEVLRAVCGIADDHPQLHVLDTTDEKTIATAAARMDPARTLFVVSSKSGGTVEVASLERFFWARMIEAEGSAAGRHFVAITDPGTALQALAELKRYRDVFLNPADIGGRFSALSLFGLVPAALIGANPGDLLAAGATMAEGCRQENHTNPGLTLGTFIGATVLEGRDKLTIVLPPSLGSLGLWVEQLVAESTGKHGTGALPVVDEPLGRPDDYGSDRAFVAITTDRDAPDEARIAALEAAGHPVLRLSTRIDGPSRHGRGAGLGSEFFRWEFATAVAGAALGINPFDEPNVSEAKEKTKALLSTYSSAGRLPESAAAAVSGGISAHSPTFAGGTPAAVVRAALESLNAGDYVAFLSYLPATSDVEVAIAEIREAIRARHHAASTFGVGPRYLHSTGQYHKGGPNTALAFVVTAVDETSTDIPEAGYSFAILKQAQALGDAETLAAHSRRVVRLHLEQGTTITALRDVFAEALR